MSFTTRVPVGWLICLLLVAGGGLSLAAAQQDCPDCLTAVALPTDVCTSSTCDEVRLLEIAANNEREPTKQTFLHFNLWGIPPEALVHSWTLRLYLHKPNDTRRYQLVQVFPVQFPPGVMEALIADGIGDRLITYLQRFASPAPEALARQEGHAQTLRVDFEHRLTDAERAIWLQTGQQPVGWWLVLRSLSPGQDYTYYSTYRPPGDLCTVGTENIPCSNLAPRLIVKYTMPATLPDPAWPQYRYDPQHTGRTPSKPTLRQTAASHRAIYSPQGYIMSDPVLHKGTLFLHTQLDNQGDKKYFLSAVRENGTPVWHRPLRGVLKFPPIVNRRGHLFLVMEDRVGVVDPALMEQLAAANDPYPWGGNPLSIFLPGQEEVSIRATPTLGLTYMLLPTNRGLFAMPSGLAHEVFWQYTTQDNAFGPAALSPDERTVYVVDGKKGALVALDNTDGTPKWSHQILNPPDHPSCKKDTPQDVTDFQTYPPVPVVGKDGQIYVTDGYFKDQVHYPGRCLQVFTATGQTLQPITTGGPKALISQVVLDAQGQAYFIQEQEKAGTGRLCVWNPQQPAPPQCSANPDTLDAHNILVMDGNDNIYVLDSINNPQRIQGYTKQLAPLFDLKVPQTDSAAKGSSTNFMRNLLVASDGTLYTRNDNHLFAVTPGVSQ